MTSSIRSQSAPRCHLCGSLGEQFLSGLRDRLFGAPGTWSISRCKNSDCDLLWLDPSPLQDDIHIAYNTYYTHTPINTGKTSFAQTASNVLAKIIDRLNEHLGLASEQRDVRDMHLNEMKPGTLLEVGCGSALLLHRMKQRGWQVEGVDFDEKAAAAAMDTYAISVKTGSVEDIKYADNSFDAVVLRHVIEHLFDPIATMKELRRIVKPGGRIIVLTPNSNCLGLRTFKSDWRGLEPPRHIHIFNVKALRKLAEAAGLKISRAYSSSVSSWYVHRSSLFLAANLEREKWPGTISGVPYVIKSLRMHSQEAKLNALSGTDGEECILIATKN